VFFLIAHLNSTGDHPLTTIAVARAANIIAANASVFLGDVADGTNRADIVAVDMQ
jgi:magnesium-transporting ATPase (P-type)